MKINLPLKIKKQMCKFSKYRCGIFHPEFGIGWKMYLSLIWRTIPQYIEKITITYYKKNCSAFKMKININYKAPTQEKSSGIFSKEVVGLKFLSVSLRHICSGSQPVFGVFQVLRCQILGHKIKCPMSV